MPASTDPLKDLDAFVGEWNVAGAMTLDEPMEISGWTGFEWLAGGGVPGPTFDHRAGGFPNTLAVIGPADEGEGYVMHYFDSRGVSRIYKMSLDGRSWTLDREPSGPRSDFWQRWIRRVQRGREHDPGPLGDVRRRLRLGARLHLTYTRI